MTYFWLALMVAAIVLEAATPQMVSIWFAAGSLIAFIAALCGAPVWLQVVLFFSVSVLLLFFTRPLVKRLRSKNTPTNADRCIGGVGTVTVEINNDRSEGRIRSEGMDWKAASATGEILPKDTLVRIRSIEGVTVIVEKID